MPKEEKGESAEDVNAEKLDTSKDEPQSKEEVGEKPPEIPDEYKGKSPTDLIKMVTDAQKELGSRAKHIGDLENNLAFSKQLRELELQRARESGSQAAQQPQEPKVDWNFEKPVESVEQIIDKRLNARERTAQQYNVQRVREEAQSNYAEGRRTSMKRNPALYEGIEREVEDAVYEGYQRGHAKLHELRSPDAWDIVAKMIHLRDNRIDRLQPAAIQAVETVGGELPTPARPGTTEKPFTGLDYTDEEVQKMVKQYGLTKEEAEEIVKGEQEAIARGEKR